MSKQPKSVSAYIDALTWDGQPRIDRWLILLAGAQDTPYVREVACSVFADAERRARYPSGIKQGKAG